VKGNGELILEAAEPIWLSPCNKYATNNVLMAGYTNSTTGIATGGHQNTYGVAIMMAFLA
jgi:hypothetical protein